MRTRLGLMLLAGGALLSGCVLAMSPIFGLVLLAGGGTVLWLVAGRADRVLGRSLSLALWLLALLPPTAFDPSSVLTLIPPVGAVALLLLGFMKRSVRPFPAWYCLAGIYLLAWASTWRHQNINVYFMGIGVVVLVAALTCAGLNDSERYCVWRTVLVIALAQLPIGLLELALGSPLIGLRPKETGTNPLLSGTERIQGTMGHPLVLALLLLIALALVATMPGIHRLLRTGLAVAIFAGLVLSGSTSGVLGAVLIMVAVAWDGASIGRRIVIAWAAVTTVVTAFGAALVPLSIVTDLNEEQLAHRLGSIEGIPRLITDRPLIDVLTGNGLNSAEQLFRWGIFHNDGFYAIDNQVATTLAESGVIGLGLLVSLTVWVWRTSGRIERGVLAVLLLMSPSFDVLSWYFSAILLGMLVGLRQRGHVSTRAEGAESHERELPPPSVRLAADIPTR